MARTFSFEEALQPRKEKTFSFEQAMGIEPDPQVSSDDSRSGFVPALKAGVSGVQEAGYALAGRTGLMDEAAAQKAIEEEQAYQSRVFRPTEEGFLEAPLTKTTELLGQSIPFMGVPLVAAGAAALAPLTGTAATVATLGAAGLASAGQFTGTNLLRQMEPTDTNLKGRSIGETELGNAALAAIPQAALDVLSFRMMPFIRGVFGQAGKDLSEEAARRIASKNIKDVAADYALATGTSMTVEGLTEAAQQSLERLQAGLSITDQSARDEYLESFIGGAVLGGVLAPPGRYLERRSAQKAIAEQDVVQPSGQPPGQIPPSGQPPGQPPVQPDPGVQPPGQPPVDPTQPSGLMPGMVEADPDLSIEEEADLQQRISQGSTRSSLSQETKTDSFVVSDAINEDTPQEVQLSIRPDGTGNIQYKDRIIDVTEMIQAGFTPERIVAQVLGEDTTGKNVTRKEAVTAPPAPEALAQIEALNIQLAKVQAKRLDPTLSPDDPVFSEFDKQESQIKSQIQQLSAPKSVVVQQPPQPESVVLQQPVALQQPPETVVKQQIEPTIEDQFRAQKTQERRERQAEEAAKKGEFVLQNRDRSGSASLEQMENIAKAPDYGRAGFSRTPDGAPIVSFANVAQQQLGRQDEVTTASGRKIPIQYAVVEADSVLASNDIQGRTNVDYGNKDVVGTRAIAGNGRITGLREAYRRGTANRYIQDMANDSPLHGVSTDTISEMDNPVLVRIMPQEMLTKDIGDDLNKSSMLELSPVEQAKNDLNRVDFDAIKFDESGEINQTSLSQFINAQPVEERSRLVDQGLPTKQARQRLENAIFARAYNDDSLIAMFAQADDAESKLVINALAQVAPQMARLEGAGDLDIRDIVTDAAKIIISGKRRGLKLAEIANQVDMTVDPDTRIIVGLFAQNTRSNKAAIEALNNAADIAYKESIRPEEGLFGAEPRMERRELVEQIRRSYEPGRTQDVAQTQRPRVAPSDVERKVEPSPAAVPPADQGFALTGQTQEELAELERKEKTGEAQREIEEREAKELADRARDVFTLERTRAEPTPVAPPLKPSGDMFGAASQPTSITAPATPIEEAAKPKYEIKRKESYRGNTTPDIEYQVLKDGKILREHKRRKDAQQYLDMLTLSKEEVEKKYPELIAPKAEPQESKAAAVDVPPIDEAIEAELKKAKFNDLDKMSKDIQESFGVSKPVADAYAKAVQNSRIQFVRSQYGEITGEQLVAANDEVTRLRNRIDGIVKRKEGKAKAAPVVGEILATTDLPDNMQVRLLKATNGFSVQMYDKDSDNVVDGSIRIFKESMFEGDPLKAVKAFKMAREYADQLAGEARQETKEAEEAAPKAKPNFYQELLPKAGFTRLDINDPRTYKNKSGDQFITFERDGVRVAFESGNLLYVDERGRAGRYVGNDSTSPEGADSVFAALIVDPKDRKQGKARKALQEIVKMADESNTNLYLEPASLDTEGMTTPQLKDFYQQFGFKPQETAPATDKVMIRKARTKPEPAKKVLGSPTIADMQAALDELKKERIALGIPDVTLPVRDAKVAQAERDAKQKKKDTKILKASMRSEEEEKVIKFLSGSAIIGTPEQLSVVSNLAKQVDGKLVFYNNKFNLGLVVVDGYKYYPIHNGKISKVDVSDYTGLSKEDKAFLNTVAKKIRAIRASLSLMLKGTEDQQKNIRAVAETVGGTPVYLDPDTNIGLVRGYGQLTGKPVYAMTIGDKYSTADVEESTLALFAPYKAKLIEVKKRLEEEAAKKHKDNPFIKFENGLAMSENIDDSLRGVITGWKPMLGLENVNIYFSTIEDAKTNRDNFTGPHRVIGSGTLDANQAGSIRRMEDGSYYVLFSKSTSKSAMLETIAHELGHIHEREAYENAPQDLKNKLKEAHQNWVQTRKDKTSREAVDMLRAKTTAQTTLIGPGKNRAEDLSPYWSSFSEWYADQVSRWAVTDEKPVSVVEKFFVRLGAALRRFYQTLKGQRYLPDETFVQYLNQVNPTIVETIPGPIKDPVQVEMSFQMQKNLFGSTQEAQKIGEIMEVKGKRLPVGRSPELSAAAQSVKAGTMTAEEYNKLVDVYRPIPIYAEPLKPATSEQVFDALDIKKREQINPVIPNGTRVGLRLDIPAFNRKGVFVVSIHQKRTASSPGKVIGYGSVAKAKNVTFGLGNQLKALDIATGEAKDALQTMEGEYINVSPEQALAEAQRAIKDPNYVQIGIDPTRHAYFYDRRTTLPVVSAEEIIQIGNMILAKKPVFGSKSDFLYNIESQDVAGGEQATPDAKEFKALLERLREEDDAKREVERQEKITYYASIRRKEVTLQKRVRNYGSTIEIQRSLNNLNQIAKQLKEDIDLDKSPVYTAENFLRQARAAVDGVVPYKDQAISPDVFAVIQAVYMDDPRLLEGLRLSIKPEFKPDEALLRKAFGVPRASGSFTPFQRLVSLYTGTRGVKNPITIRHEITHTLEQMMTPAQRQALLSSYFKAVEKAVKKHKDARSQEFFEKLLEFLDKPNRKNQAALNKLVPSYDFYQYVNPSEYWAVNAEKLMAQRLGTSWDRFKKAVRKMFEKMKQIFGFDNRFVVHQVFDQVMSGSKKRLTRSMLADYIKADGDSFDFLENIEDDADLMRRSGKGDTPMLELSPVKRIIIRGATNAKESFKEMVENPSEILRMTFNPIVRGVLYLRNKNIWFGTALNEADRIRYNGQVRVSEFIATASLALDNMIRGGNIATQVLFQGGLEFNPKTLMFGAVKRAMSMTNVYKAEAVIKKRLGDQLGTNIIQGYLEAKRSRSIKNEVITRQEAFDIIDEALDNKVAELKALEENPNASEKEINKVDRELRKLFREHQDAKKDLETIKTIAKDKVSMNEDMIEEFISRDKVHPELREIMDNFNSVNQNMLRFWRQVGLLSENRYNTLSQIKDYVPWYRIMDDEADIHSPLQATTRSATNIGKEKLFGPGKPSVINDFIIEENQAVFKIQPGRVNAVKLQGKKLKPGDYEVTSQGEVTLKVPYQPGDVLVIETQREIENMIDNMTRNVMRMTMNGLRQYAAQRIVSEYATRDSDGKIMTFGKADPAKGRFDFIRDGRRTVVEIQDPLLAEAVLGMESVGMQMWKPLAAAANFTRRTITLSPVFQVKQVFKDAPTAALVTGVKRPDLLLGGVYKGFIDAIRDSDPAAGILRSVGIGGFYSPARTPEADVKRQIGIINNSTYDYVLKALDHFGDSSDMAQRIAIYNRVMAETGDEALAMYQAANVINFLRHGSGQVAQALVKTVPFLNAYAQSIDVLYNALVGGGLRGLDRKKAMQRLFVTGSLLAGTTLLYAMLVGDDEDYMKMDDQSKVRSYMIPGTDIVLPMNTSAAFFFKAIPELTYNAIVSQGTENAMDEKRVRRAMKEAAVDLLLGPTPVPSAVKPVIEISLNYDFFTSRPVIPAGLKDLDAYQQYDMRTSEAAKLLSSLTGGEENRVINPVEADHLIRGIFGTVGGMVAWSSNLIGEASEVRPEMGLKEMPITGAFLRPEVPRGREDLFYDLKSSTDRKFKTFNRLADRDVNEAEAYLEKHPNLIAFYDYTSEMDTQLKELNAAVRFIAETTDRSYTPEIKRKEIQELLNLKQEILEGVERFRREAYAD